MHEDRFLLSVACCVENSFRFVSLVYTRLKLFCRFSVQVDMIRLSTWSSHGVFFITSRGYGFGRISGILIHFKNFQFICLSLPVGRQQYNNSTFWPHVLPHAQTQETKEWAALTWTSTRQTGGG